MKWKIKTKSIRICFNLSPFYAGWEFYVAWFGFYQSNYLSVWEFMLLALICDSHGFFGLRKNVNEKNSLSNTRFKKSKAYILSTTWFVKLN